MEKEISHEPWEKKSAMEENHKSAPWKIIHESLGKLVQQKQWTVNIKIDVKFKFRLGSNCNISLIESFYSFKIYARIEL
jgi:hypothetical protein